MWSNLCAPLIALSTAVRNKVTKTMSEKQLLRNNWSKLFSNSPWEPSSWSLLLISPGPANDCPAVYDSPALDPCSWSLLDRQTIVQLSMRAQLHLPVLDLSWTGKWLSYCLWKPSSTSLLLISPCSSSRMGSIMVYWTGPSFCTRRLAPVWYSLYCARNIWATSV